MTDDLKTTIRLIGAIKPFESIEEVRADSAMIAAPPALPEHPGFFDGYMHGRRAALTAVLPLLERAPH